jgi:hypothetical protein
MCVRGNLKESYLMKSVLRYLVLASVLGLFSLAQVTWAGECCTTAKEKAKAGEACKKCVEHECCKAAIKGMPKEEKKACTKCAGAGEKKEGEKKEGEKKEDGHAH